MKQIFSLILFLLFNCAGFGQPPIDDLIQAEKNFAAYSVANSTKEAFLKFIDSNGIVFDKGIPVNGIEVWTKREKRPGILNWYPLHAEIASSGDFGYTTGPWTFQTNSIKDSIVAQGYYTTVWQKDKNGKWKFLIDLGVSNTPVDLVKEVNKINILKQFDDTRVIPHVSPIVIAENGFIELLKKGKSKGYNKYLSLQSILNRNGHAPAISGVAQKKLIDSTSSSVQYKMDGWGMAASQDIGYVYGTTIINGKTDNYLRIWRKEKVGWKIAVEVLLY
jgi:ketosteroid isomerase-like protein